MRSQTNVQYYATGRRKTAAARVFLRAGSGKLSINARALDHFFTRETLRMKVLQPLALVGEDKSFDLLITVAGGGMTGQAEAIRHGIARALCAANANHRTPLKRAGYLTRDDRMVERKKYGRPGARKRFQFSKR